MSFSQIVMLSKENSLSFSNITRRQHILPVCEHHSDKVAKFRSKDTNTLYCYSCAIRQASRGQTIQQIQNQSSQSFQQIKYHGKSTQSPLIEDVSFLNDYNSNEFREQEKKSVQQQKYRLFQQAQKDIKANINEYNAIFHQISELLTDIQIKDIMFFNKQLQQSEKAYESGRMMISPGCSPAQSVHLTQSDVKKGKETTKKMKKLLQIIQQVLSEQNVKSEESFENKQKNIAKPVGWIGNHRSISPSQLKKYSNNHHNQQPYPSSNASSTNVQLDHQRYSFNSQTIKRQPLIKAKSFKNGSSINSNGSIPQSSNASINPSSGKGSSGQGSQHKNSNFRKNQLQDTPQSIKSKISGQNLAVPKEIAVQMFQKISVCESIDLSAPTKEEPPKPVTNWMMESTGNSIAAETIDHPSRSSIKAKKSRYDKTNNPDTER